MLQPFAPAWAFHTDVLIGEMFHAEVSAASAGAGGLMDATHTRVWALLRSGTTGSFLHDYSRMRTASQVINSVSVRGAVGICSRLPCRRGLPVVTCLGQHLDQGIHCRALPLWVHWPWHYL